MGGKTSAAETKTQKVQVECCLNWKGTIIKTEASQPQRV